MPDQQSSKEQLSRSELIKALKKFQETCPPIAKDKEGYGYKYAPLEKFLSVVNPALNKVGLFQNQTYEMVFSDNDISKTILVTTIYHENGHSISSRLPVLEPLGRNPKKDIMHEWGGITTYSRRYALKMILGIEPDMDMNMEDLIDRSGSSKPKAEEQKPAPWVKPEIKGISDDEQPLPLEERNLLLGLIKEIKDANGEEAFKKFCKEFREAFDLAANAKISGHVKTRKHERFFQQWNP
tara:strand:+ start:15586 stop:16302 length:717 start_codon:yes stop_codon:yes gene_type:complete